MDTIKNYLNTMFKDLPNTEEVLKAKNELESMMEDKYTELLDEDIPEHEAIAQIIAEFGNIEDIFPDTEDMKDENMMDFNVLKDYLSYKKDSALLIAIGVGLCILSVICPILGSIHLSTISESIGVAGMFVCIAVAVGLFIKSYLDGKKYEDIKESVPTNEMLGYVRNEKEKFHSQYTLFMVIGVGLCIMSVVPAIILSALSSNEVFDNLSGAGLFLLVGIGVALIVYSNIINESFDINKEIEDDDEEEDGIYWTIVLAIYLCWSFLSFEWYRTWIIWPIAAILQKPIIKVLGGFIHE